MRKTFKQLLVSYSYSAGIEGFGFGNTTQFMADKKRISPNEIREMEQIIKEEKGFENVVIMNVQFI